MIGTTHRRPAALLAALLILGCAGETAPAPPSAAEQAAAPEPLGTSINAVMVGVVDHAAHHLWDLGLEGAAPSTDEEWDEAYHHALQLVAAGPSITAGGTGELDEGWVEQPAWRSYVRALTSAAAAAAEGAEARDLERVLGAGDALIEACEGCHAEYKPALPSEGIVHPHR